MKQYLLDTNICIHYIKGEFGLREKVDDIGFDNCFLSEITIAELLFGIAKSDQPGRLLTGAMWKYCARHLKGRNC